MGKWIIIVGLPLLMSGCSWFEQSQPKFINQPPPGIAVREGKQAEAESYCKRYSKKAERMKREKSGVVDYKCV